MNESQRILVLEDNMSNAELIRFYLEEDGYTVEVVGTGCSIFESIRTFKPDLITIDILLPDTDGLWIVHQLKADPATMNIPVIFISIAEDKFEEGMKLGARGFLTKPFKQADLRRALRQALTN